MGPGTQITLHVADSNYLGRRLGYFLEQCRERALNSSTPPRVGATNAAARCCEDIAQARNRTRVHRRPA